MPNQHLLDVANAIESSAKKITDAVERLRQKAKADDTTNVFGTLAEIGGNGSLISSMARRAAVGPPP